MREITIIFTNQSCVQYKPWKCPRRRLTVWYGKYVTKPGMPAAANTITNHSELYPKVLNSVNRSACNIMKCQSTYMIKSESMLYNKPDEITRFSHSSASFLSRGF